VYVGESPIHGKGLFAAVELAAGHWIGTFEGRVTREDGMHVLWIEGDEGEWTGYDGINDLRFLNHSDQPNAEMQGLQCFALTAIPRDREITIDYGWNEA